MSATRSRETTVETFRASLTTTVSSSALPHARVTVLIELSSDSSSVAGQPLRAVCAGLQREPVEFTQSGSVDCVEVRLPPSVALGVGLEVGNLSGGLAPAEHLFGERAESLADRLSETPVTERPELIRGALRARLERTSPSAVTEVIRSLEHAPVSQTVGDLVRDIGGTRSTLWRMATAALGMSPKEFLMLRRFESGVGYVRAGHPIARAAVDAGYVDQAHFHRHVRRFARQTPARLRRATDATFVQDGDNAGLG